MRLGRDALIFTKNGGCLTVGMLSQSYLQAIKAQAVIVPIVPFNQQTNILTQREIGPNAVSLMLWKCFLSVCHANKAIEFERGEDRQRGRQTERKTDREED